MFTSSGEVKTLAMVTATKAHKHCMGPPGPRSAWSSVVNLALVNASKPDKHCIGPPGRCSACSWVKNLDVVNVSKPHPALIGPSGPIQRLELGYEPGLQLCELKQSS